MMWLARPCMLALILSVTLVAQDVTPSSLDAVTLVKTLMARPQLFLIGFETKVLQRSGDAVAVAIVRTQAQTILRDPDQAHRVMLLMSSAFQSPDLIANTLDKNPGVSLLVLETILRETSDATLQKDTLQLKSKLESIFQPASARSSEPVSLIQGDAFSLIEGILGYYERTGGLFVTGWQDKLAWHFGDSVAVAIAKTRALSVLRDRERTLVVILLIKMAFGDPTRIENRDDRNPGVSLLMLDMILREVSDAEVQKYATELKTKLQGIVQGLTR